MMWLIELHPLQETFQVQALALEPAHGPAILKQSEPQQAVYEHQTRPPPFTVFPS